MFSSVYPYTSTIDFVFTQFFLCLQTFSEVSADDLDADFSNVSSDEKVDGCLAVHRFTSVIDFYLIRSLAYINVKLTIPD